MLLGTRHMNSIDDNDNNYFEIILDGTKLDRVKTTTFLGVTIDENITWKNHIDNVSKTISRNIGVMNKLKHFVPERILYSLYCSLVLPYINYGILVWGNTCKTYLDKLLKLQKWALRVISNSHYRSHSGPLFAKFHILNIFDTYNLELGVFMFKYSTDALPNVFDNFFLKRSSIHNYHTRFNNDYNQTRNKKSFSDHSVRTQGPILWNSFNKNIKKSNSIKHFRNQYKNQLLSNYK